MKERSIQSSRGLFLQEDADDLILTSRMAYSRVRQRHHASRFISMKWIVQCFSHQVSACEVLVHIHTTGRVRN